MSLEGDGDSPKPSKLSQSEQTEFASGAKLTGDSFNLWEDVKTWFDYKLECERSGGPFTLKPLKPIEHYEAYYRRVRSWNPESADELIEKSDPSAVAAFDALADEFNSHLEEILQNGRDEAMKYVRRAAEIIYQKK